MKRVLLLAVLLPLSPAAAETEAERGQKLAVLHCGRCHVVPGGNPFGSIGSTPSFRVLRNHPEWEALFRSFHVRPPHAAITRIEGVTPLPDEARPSPVAPVVMTEAEAAAILSFVATIAPKDVGRVE